VSLDPLLLILSPPPPSCPDSCRPASSGRAQRRRGALVAQSRAARLQQARRRSLRLAACDHPRRRHKGARRIRQCGRHEHERRKALNVVAPLLKTRPRSPPPLTSCRPRARVASSGAMIKHISWGLGSLVVNLGAALHLQRRAGVCVLLLQREGFVYS
jgi:hypothetical protein